MRIGFFTSVFPYAESFQNSSMYFNYPVGGAEIVAYNLAKNIVRQGHEVSVFTCSIDSKYREEDQNGVKIYRYGTNFRMEKAFVSFSLFFQSLKHDVDIVHLHFSTPPGNLAAMFYALVKRKPFIITYHGDAPENFGNPIRRVLMFLFNRLCANRILSSASTIITPSKYYVDQSRFLRKHKSKIIEIPNGINPGEIEISFTREECRQKLSFEAGDAIILFIGALMESKKPDLLIEALPAILKENPDARLVIAGEGSMRESLKQLAVKLGVSGRVMFPGGVVGELKAIYYKAADIFAFPSVMEVFPLVFLEASVAGLPLVVSSLETFRVFIKDGYNGIVTRSGDLNSLTESIKRLLSDPVLRKELGENARQSALGFSWENIAETTEDLYVKTLGPGRSQY
jgi:glycosyltransferase involved in cell wall biosynthesis